MAGGLTWALLAERAAARWWPRSARRAAMLLVLLGIGLLVAHAPPVGDFYVTGGHPRLYAYLRSLPPETRVATLPGDGSILPLFAQRPVLISWEHALPYHPAYYEPPRGRARALLQAYFAEAAGPILDLADREGVGVVVANQLERRRRGRPLALEVLAPRRGAVREHDLVAIPIDCARSRAATMPPAPCRTSAGRLLRRDPAGRAARSGATATCSRRRRSARRSRWRPHHRFVSQPAARVS